MFLPLTGVADSTAKGHAVIGDDLRHAQQLFQESTSLIRRDCDPVGDGRWICASFDNPDIKDLAGVNSEVLSSQFVLDTNSPDAFGEDKSSQTLDSSPKLAAKTIARSLPLDTLYQAGDLISLNYDSCPDPDDMHAAVAAKMVLDHYGLQNGSDYIVTNGTCGDLRPRSDYITTSGVVFDELYGTNWNDAFLFESLSIGQVGDSYLQRLEAGAHVWVLDGGPMDFTARVIAYMRGVGTNADLESITVVQHSHGWNEEHTDPTNLSFMDQHVRYLKIDNGNHRGNRTTQLNQSNQQAAFPDVDLDLVDRFASDTRYSDAWDLAFELLSTENRFDGSDTVELLWVLGLESSLLEDWYDFADLFIPEVVEAPVVTAPENERHGALCI